MTYRSYSYPSFVKALSMGIFLIGIILIVAGLVVTLALVAGNGRISAVEFTAPLFVVSFGALWTFIFVVQRMQTPDLRVHQDGFQLKTLFYTSPWLAWEDIRFIDRVPLSSKRRGNRLVSAGPIHWIYGYVGLSYFKGSRVFVLSPWINGYDELVATFKKHRPDLAAEL